MGGPQGQESNYSFPHGQEKILETRETKKIFDGNEIKPLSRFYFSDSLSLGILFTNLNDSLNLNLNFCMRNPVGTSKIPQKRKRTSKKQQIKSSRKQPAE